MTNKMKSAGEEHKRRLNSFKKSRGRCNGVYCQLVFVSCLKTALGRCTSMHFQATRSCANVLISLGKGGFSGLISLAAYSWNRTLRPTPFLDLPCVGWYSRVMASPRTSANRSRKLAQDVSLYSRPGLLLFKCLFRNVAHDFG